MESKRSVVRAVLEGELDAAHASAVAVTESESGSRGVSPPLDLELARQVDAAIALLADDPDVVVDYFRGLLDDDELTERDVRQLLHAARLACRDPDAYYDLVLAEQLPETAIAAMDDGIRAARAAIHAPSRGNQRQTATLEKLLAQHALPAEWKDLDPSSRKFESSDLGWIVTLDGKIGEKWNEWPGLAPFRPHSAAHRYVYDGPDDADSCVKVGLFSDFGNGTYQAAGVARCLREGNYPQVFHLGDVYYRGTSREFARYFRKPLEPVVATSELFCLAENHELYTGGVEYLKCIDALRRDRRTRQEGSYFCVRYPHHQIIGLDVNWEHRQRLLPASPQRAWLEYVFATGGDRTTILLTGSAPYVHGKSGACPILADMKPFVQRIHMWFWGDNHYCALFDRHPQLAPFVGSCIGHGGHPFKKQSDTKRTFEVEKLWLETEARFPAWTQLRQDMGNNGWCELTMLPGGHLELLYVDWLGARRCRVTLERKPGPPAHLAVKKTSSGHKCEVWERPREQETTADLRARGVLHNRQ